MNKKVRKGLKKIILKKARCVYQLEERKKVSSEYGIASIILQLSWIAVKGRKQTSGRCCVCQSEAH